MNIAYRDMKPEDRRFVVDSWAKAYRTAHAAGLIQMADWFPIMIPQIEQVLEKPNVRTIIAYDPDETDGIADITGFVVANTVAHPPLVYWISVKDFYKRHGVARGLFEAIGIDPERPFDMVCKTPIVTTLARKIPCARFNPIRGRYLNPDHPHAK